MDKSSSIQRGQAQSVTSSMATRSLKEAKFGGYSVTVAPASSGGPRASVTSAPLIGLSRNRGLIQRLCDWWNSSGKTPVQESRKMDALIDFIKTGDIYGKGGKLEKEAATVGARIVAFKQVLGGKYATPEQKASAADALNVFLKGQESVDLQELKGLRSVLQRGGATLPKSQETLLSEVKQRIEVLEINDRIESIGNVGGKYDLNGKEITMTIGMCVKRFQSVLGSKVATLEHKQQACVNMLHSLQNSTPSFAELQELAGDIANSGLKKNEVPSLEALDAYVNGEIARIKIDESIEKLGKPVEIPDEFVEGNVNEVNNKLESKVVTCGRIVMDKNATPEQKMKAVEALKNVLGGVNERYIKADLLEEMSSVILSMGIGASVSDEVKNAFSELRSDVALKHDLFLLKSGGLPGKLVFGESSLKRAGVKERVNAFQNVMRNGSPDQKQDACLRMKNFITGSGPKYEGLERHQLLDIKSAAERVSPGLADLADKVYTLKWAGDAIKQNVDEFLSMSPKAAAAGGIEGYESRLQAAMRAHKDYSDAMVALGHEAPPPNKRLEYMNENFQQLKAKLEGRASDYMKILRNEGGINFQKEKLSTGLVVTKEVPADTLAPSTLEVFHMRAANDSINWATVDYNNDPANLRDVNKLIINGFMSLPNETQLKYIA